MKKTASLISAIVLAAGLAIAQDDKPAKDDSGDKKTAQGNAEKGKETFEQCGACHNTDSPEKKMGPSLQGLFKRPKLKNGKPVTDANVRAVMNAGGNGMPAYADLLSDEEKADVIAYLKTL